MMTREGPADARNRQGSNDCTVQHTVLRKVTYLYTTNTICLHPICYARYAHTLGSQKIQFVVLQINNLRLQCTSTSTGMETLVVA